MKLVRYIVRKRNLNTNKIFVFSRLKKAAIIILKLYYHEMEEVVCGHETGPDFVLACTTPFGLPSGLWGCARPQEGQREASCGSLCHRWGRKTGLPGSAAFIPWGRKLQALDHQSQLVFPPGGGYHGFWPEKLYMQCQHQWINAGELGVVPSQASGIWSYNEQPPVHYSQSMCIFNGAWSNLCIS